MLRAWQGEGDEGVEGRRHINEGEAGRRGRVAADVAGGWHLPRPRVQSGRSENQPTHAGRRLLHPLDLASSITV
jgi:hypothetical protein